MFWCRCTRLGLGILLLVIAPCALSLRGGHKRGRDQGRVLCQKGLTVPVEDVEGVDHHDGQCTTSPHVWSKQVVMYVDGCQSGSL